MKTEFNKFLENEISKCDSVSVDDFFDMDDEIIEAREIAKEEVPEDILEFEEAIRYTEEMLKDAKPWDAPFWKVYYNIKTMMRRIFDVCRKHPVIMGVVSVVCTIFYIWTIAFIIKKCFGVFKNKQ